MEKIENFKFVEKYFCSKHNRIHNKYRNHKKTKSFEQCKDTAFSLTDTELFKMKFKRMWNNYKESKEYNSHLANIVSKTERLVKLQSRNIKKI